MKLGFGLYKHMLNEEHYKFAKQCGATHLVIHLVDYFGHEKNSKENTKVNLVLKITSLVMKAVVLLHQISMPTIATL